MVAVQQIAIAGCTGKMGRALLRAVRNASECQLAAALVPQGSQWVGKEVGHLIGDAEMTLLTDQLSTLHGVDCLIDFTHPQGTLAHLAWCRQHHINMVIGTTGFTMADEDLIKAASEDIAIVYAPNMSVGVNVTLKLLQLAAQLLSEDYDIEIVEMHHRHKVDAPSGTARQMGEVIATTLGRDLSQCAVYHREGITGARNPSTIGFSTLRGGNVVGDHTVIFAGMGERIEITHKASSRDTFAQGALRAAKFLAGKQTGLYDMTDVLGLGRETA